MDYQEHILDHYHYPRHKTPLANITSQASVKNPTCGDELTFFVLLEDDFLKEIGWEGVGCAISQASASLLAQYAQGKTVTEIMNLATTDLLELIQIPLSPGRLKCGILSLETLHKALIIPNVKTMTWKDESKPAGPVTLNNGWTLEVDHGICIGAAPCTAMAPNTFALNDENQAAILASVDADDQETILNAARACPVSAIIIKDETGNQIFPA